MTRCRLLLAVVIAAAVLATAVCGVPLDKEPRPVTGATQPHETTPTTSDSPTAQEVSVYYLVGDHLEVTRYPVDGEPTLDAALGFLLTSQPAGSAKTLIPPGTSLRKLTIDGDVARIDLTSEIIDDTSGETQKLAFAQIVFTIASKAKVAIEAAMPERRSIAAPVSSATSAATPPPATAAGSTCQSAAAITSGRPGSSVAFMSGRSVSHAET